MRFAILFLLTTTNLTAQNASIDTFSTKLFDSYVLQITLLDEIGRSQCICAMKNVEGYNTGQLCRLYKVSVQKIIEQLDTAVYHNPNDLLDVRFITLLDKNQSLKLNFEYIAVAQNSCSDKYLVVSKLRDPMKCRFKGEYKSVIQTGLSTCYDYTMFQKLQLFIGLNKTRIRDKAKNRFLERNFFLSLISDHLGLLETSSHPDR